MSQSNLPFMTYVGGHVLVHQWKTGDVLPDGWTGLCVDGFNAEKHWYIGREGSERSFTALQAKDQQSAEAEVIGLGLVPPSTQKERDALELYSSTILASVDMVCTVLEAVRTDLLRANGESIQGYLVRALRRDFASGADGCLFPELFLEAAERAPARLRERG